MEKVKFKCPVCLKSFMVQPDRASRSMCSGCLKSYEPPQIEADALYSTAAPKTDLLREADSSFLRHEESAAEPPSISMNDADEDDDDDLEDATSSYPAMLRLAAILTVLGYVCFAGTFVTIVFAFFNIEERTAKIAIIVAAALLVLVGLWQLALAEMLKLFVNVANDVRLIARRRE